MPTQRFEEVAYTPRSDLGAAVGNSGPLARATRRPSADFEEFVLRYARAQRANVGLVFVGLGLAIGAAVRLDGGLMVAFAAVGLGLAGAGAGGYLAAAGAHAAYTRYFSATETQVYAEVPTAGPGMRPFVPSSNGAPTIRAGRFSLPAATWAALLAAADANGGRLTRDAATKVLPRALYRDWSTTAGELQRLGIIDDDGMVTAAGRDMIAGDPPHPIEDYAPTGAHSTHARRTPGAHGGQEVAL
jgi:hypothetical protein